jgi:hypothetical protein
MLIEEAKWLGKQLCDLGDEYFPMINTGSSSSVFRTQIQPYVDEYVFKPLREQGKKVFHADIRDAEGMDLVGDLNDDIFIRQVKKLQIKSVLSTNLLEHVTSPQTVCLHLEDMLGSGGIMIVSVPRRYPYHKDPIDTKFRPSVDELCGLFPNCTLLHGETVTSADTQAKMIRKKNPARQSFKRHRHCQKMAPAFARDGRMAESANGCAENIQTFSGNLCGYEEEINRQSITDL